MVGVGVVMTVHEACKLSTSLFKWFPTESASVPIASYRMSKFLAWYCLKAIIRTCRMPPKYGTSSVHASSSRVAKAL